MFLGYHILIKFYKNGELTNDFPKESYRYYEKNAIDGDLQGVIKELDYLKELGIDLIYLGPIFKSKTTHGYDITNYFSISENISSNSEEDAKAIFKKLIEDAHKRGIKVIIDLVLNHASKEFDFNSVPKDLNIKTESPRSPQEERWQRSFLFWNLDDEDTREFLIRVGEYWLKNFELDGFRLDHALGLPLNFLEEFSIRMKKIKKDVIILGEVWEDEGDKLKNFNLLKKFKGDDAQRFTSMFDFSTYDTIKEVLGKKNGSLLDLYNQIVLSNQLNEKEFQLTYFIENHDLPRFIDICQELETFYIALGLLMALTGNVILEYGNEIALKGDQTIQNFHESGRVAMRFKEDWSDLEKQTFNYCKNLIKLRRVHPSLSSGSYELITSEENLLIFKKKAACDEIKVLIYTGEQEYQLDKEYFDLIRDTKVLKLKKGIYYLQ
jgi:glycosidase